MGKPLLKSSQVAVKDQDKRSCREFSAVEHVGVAKILVRKLIEVHSIQESSVRLGIRRKQQGNVEDNVLEERSFCGNARRRRYGPGLESCDFEHRAIQLECRDQWLLRGAEHCDLQC